MYGSINDVFANAIADNETEQIPYDSVEGHPNTGDGGQSLAGAMATLRLDDTGRAGACKVGGPETGEAGMLCALQDAMMSNQVEHKSVPEGLPGPMDEDDFLAMQHRRFMAGGARPLLKRTQNPHYKTRLCNNYLNGQSCPYGDKCRFAHGRPELRRLRTFKVDVCRNDSKGFCRYGQSCRYVHQNTPDSARAIALSPIPHIAASAASLANQDWVTAGGGQNGQMVTAGSTMPVDMAGNTMSGTSDQQCINAQMASINRSTNPSTMIGNVEGMGYLANHATAVNHAPVIKHASVTERASLDTSHVPVKRASMGQMAINLAPVEQVANNLPPAVKRMSAVSVGHLPLNHAPLDMIPVNHASDSLPQPRRSFASSLSGATC
eukprot:510027_1